MICLRILLMLVLANSALGQSHGPCYRAFTDTPMHERIFLAKVLVKEQPTVAELPSPATGDTNLMARLFANASKERAGLLALSCASEIPLGDLAVRCPGDLLSARDIRRLLSCMAVVPRKHWVDHQTKFE